MHRVLMPKTLKSYNVLDTFRVLQMRTQSLQEARRERRDTKNPYSNVLFR
jgi:hypothetical protein